MDRASTISTVVCISLLLSAPVLAAPALDQYQNGAGGQVASFWDSVLLGQTFTAGQSGTLDHVSIGAQERTYPATVEIRNTTGTGEPGTTVLGSTSMPTGFVTGWNDVDFSSLDIPMTAGTTYAIVLLNSDPSNADFVNANWNPAPCTGGGLWCRGWCRRLESRFQLRERGIRRRRRHAVPHLRQPDDPGPRRPASGRHRHRHRSLAAAADRIADSGPTRKSHIAAVKQHCRQGLSLFPHRCAGKAIKKRQHRSAEKRPLLESGFSRIAGSTAYRDKDGTTQ